MDVFKSLSPEETYAYAKGLAGEAAAGAIYCLHGELGAGKTLFAQGFAAGLGITEPVVSPTFTIVQVYEGGRLPLYHFDLYRIEDAEELFEVGLDEYIYGQGVCLIEWPECVEDTLPAHVDLYIEKDMSCPGLRRIRTGQAAAVKPD